MIVLIGYASAHGSLRGAIEKSQTELAQGNNPAAHQLAQRIISTQQAETSEVPVWSTRAVAAQVMMAVGSDAVIASDNGRLLGIVTASDLVASLAEPAPAGTPLRTMTTLGGPR
jgi:CBS domain-containing protein